MKGATYSRIYIRLRLGERRAPRWSLKSLLTIILSTFTATPAKGLAAYAGKRLATTSVVLRRRAGENHVFATRRRSVCDGVGPVGARVRLRVGGLSATVAGAGEPAKRPKVGSGSGGSSSSSSSLPEPVLGPVPAGDPQQPRVLRRAEGVIAADRRASPHTSNISEY
jgi:hypothetical protein